MGSCGGVWGVCCGDTIFSVYTFLDAGDYMAMTSDVFKGDMELSKKEITIIPNTLSLCSSFTLIRAKKWKTNSKRDFWGNQSINYAQKHLFVSLKVNNSGRHEREDVTRLVCVSSECFVHVAMLLFVAISRNQQPHHQPKGSHSFQVKIY